MLLNQFHHVPVTFRFTVVTAGVIFYLPVLLLATTSSATLFMCLGLKNDGPAAIDADFYIITGCEMYFRCYLPQAPQEIIVLIH